MGGIIIRRATAADEPVLREMAARLADFDLPAWRTAGEVAGADERAMVAALHAAEPDDDVYVAERDEVVGGCLHIHPSTDFFGRRHAHISVIATREASEGTGVGRALMQFAEAWARERSFDLMTLNVFAGNTRAREFYERGGMKPEIIKYAKDLGNQHGKW